MEDLLETTVSNEAESMAQVSPAAIPIAANPEQTEMDDDDDGDLGMGLGDESDEDDDSDSPLLEGPGSRPPKPEAPEDGLEWNDSAILECFHLAIDSYGAEDATSTKYHWSAPPVIVWDGTLSKSETEILSSWEPKVSNLPRPGWALDPFRERATFANDVTNKSDD